MAGGHATRRVLSTKKAGCPRSLAFGDLGYHEPMRANSERLAAPQVLADYFLNSLHNDPQKSSSPSSSWHLLFAPPFSRKPPKEAETPRNSLSWTILQGTSLFSRFYGATLPVNSRKQGICLQNRGGGTRCTSFAVISRPPDNLSKFQS